MTKSNIYHFHGMYNWSKEDIIALFFDILFEQPLGGNHAKNSKNVHTRGMTGVDLFSNPSNHHTDQYRSPMIYHTLRFYPDFQHTKN